MKLDSLDNLLEMINKENGWHDNPLTLDNVTVGPPTAIDINTRDTQVVISTKKNFMPARGSAIFRYYRRPLADTIESDKPIFTDGTYATTHDLLEDINLRYDLNMTTDDIEDNPISGFTHTVVAKPGSYEWQNSVDIMLKMGTPLNEVITVSDLDGLHYPDTDDEIGQASIYSYGFNGTPARDFLATLAEGSNFANADLVRSLLLITPEDWVSSSSKADYNVYGTKVAYNGPTSAYEWANAEYANVVLLTLGNRSNKLSGTLVIHYN